MAQSKKGSKRNTSTVTLICVNHSAPGSIRDHVYPLVYQHGCLEQELLQHCLRPESEKSLRLRLHRTPKQPTLNHTTFGAQNGSLLPTIPQQYEHGRRTHDPRGPLQSQD